MNPSIRNLSHTSSLENGQTSSVRDFPTQSDSNSESSQTSPSQVVSTINQPSTAVPPLQQRIAINQLTTLPWNLISDVEEYQRAGFPAIGLHWRKLTEYGLRRSVRRLLQSKFPISSLGCIGGFTGENGYTISEVLSDARKMIRTAGQLRAGTVTVVTGSQGGHIRSHANRLVVASLQELVPFAALYGVQLALQPMHPLFSKSWSFLHSFDETLEILDRVGDDRLKIAFGTYHLWPEPRLLDRVGELAGRIGLVSLADWSETPRDEYDRLLPGAGRLPIAEIIQVLESHHFSGWYELEVWSRDLWKLDRRDLMRACVSSRDSLVGPLVTV